MKKAIILFVMIFTLFSLCGCNSMLETADATHGTYTDDGCISFGGALYIPIFQSKLDSYYYNAETGLLEYPESTSGITITKEGVPTLVKDIYGDDFHISTDGVYLTHRESNYPYFEDFTYCREDVYDLCVNPTVGDVQPEGYFYEYYQYDEEAKDFSVTPSYYYLTQEECQAVDHILSTIEPVEEEAYIGLDYWYPIHLEAIRDGHRRYQISVIHTTDGNTLGVTGDGVSFTTTYAIPAEWDEVFDRMVEKGVTEVIAYDNYLGQ